MTNRKMDDVPSGVRVEMIKNGPFKGLPIINIPDWAKEANCPRQPGESMLTDEEYQLVCREASENYLFTEEEGSVTCTPSGERIDCYKKVTFRKVVHKIRSIEQWELLKAEARHLEKTVPLMFLL